MKIPATTSDQVEIDLQRNPIQMYGYNYGPLGHKEIVILSPDLHILRPKQWYKTPNQKSVCEIEASWFLFFFFESNQIRIKIVFVWTML